MHCTKQVLNDLLWVGADDRRLTCFEGVYGVPDGVSYNSYLLLDEKTVLFDTVDKAVAHTFFDNVAYGLNGRKLDYLVVHHMEPDHAATIEDLIYRYPDTTIVCNAKIKDMLANYFDYDMSGKLHIVKEGDTLSTGKHNLTFVNAPMVHWPEVMMTYDLTDKILFTADAFGAFGALNGRIFADEVDFMHDWLDEAPADSEAEPITQMDVSIPAHDVTVAQLKNLTYMLYARQTLINRMTQSDCLNIPEILIQRLADAEPENPEAFTDLLDDCRAMEGLAGFDFRDGKVSMTFPFDEAQPEKWTTYANLLNRIYDAAVKATRVYPERIEPDDQNEKYLAHIWLQRLGYHGPDFKAERKILLGHLTGYCAFANGDKMQAHKDKYTAIRRERRLAEQEAAVMEVMVEEANTDE